MKTTIRYLIFAIVCIFLFPGNIWSQENNSKNGVPFYMVNPGSSKIIKSIKRNNSNNDLAPLDDYCHTPNGDTIRFVNNGTSMIGYQISPDIPVPGAAQDTNETSGDPSIVINPMFRNKIFTAGASTRYFINGNGNIGVDQEIGAYNAGTWNWSGGFIQQFDSIPDGISWNTPTVGMNRQGNRMIYYIESEMQYIYYYDGTPYWGYGQGISYSTDEGNSWTNRLIELTIPEYLPDDYMYFLENNHLAIDTNSKSPYFGRVYSAWTVTSSNQILSNYKQLNQDIPPFGEIEFKFSQGGLTWDPTSTPSIISGSTGQQDSVMNYGVNLQVGNNGQLYAVWAMYDTTTVDGLKPPWGPEVALGFTKSLDGGVSFEPAHVIINNIHGIHEYINTYYTPFYSAHGYNTFSSPVMCIDQSIIHPGRIYVAWSNLGIPGQNVGETSTFADIYVFHSDDGGNSWSTPVRINTGIWDSIACTQKFSVTPWISCDNETGKVCVIYYDDRSYCGGEGDPRFDVFTSMSKDGGTTWEESHSLHKNLFSDEWEGINDFSFCTKVVDPNYTIPADYNGIAVKDGLAYPIWTTNSMKYNESKTHPYLTISPYYIWNCIPDTVLSYYTLLNQDVKKFECQNYISTYDSVIISSGAFSFFDAGDSITLHPGFHAEANSYFHAYIDGCVPFDASKIYYNYYSANVIPDKNQENNIYKSYLYDKLIKVYPNPTNGNLTVKLGEFSGTDANLTLLNSMSETLLELTPTSQTSYNLDLSTYPKGIYFIKLFTNNRTYVNKIIYE